MAGVSLKVSVHDRELREAFARLESPELRHAAIKAIGIELVKSVRRRFNSTKQAPDGTPWAPLDPTYAASKKGPGILVESRQLRDSIVWQADGDRLAVGTVKVYGAIHQFGGTIVPRAAGSLVFRLGDRVVHARKVTIAARPFLGWSKADVAEAVATVEDHVNRAWEG